ncbi:MAG: HNH endonuclease [Deltaproteobacteria bacterium]|nr:HNH endonuclease [Deltaproteobacteria bacterium]
MMAFRVVSDPVGWKDKLKACKKFKGGYAAYETAAKAYEAGVRSGAVAAGETFADHDQGTLPTKGNSATKEFPPLWGAKDNAILARKAKMMDNAKGKCVYCESPAFADQFWQVEHFRPKSLFPTLAYAWGNYLPSCSLCNHSKSNKWPQGGYVAPHEDANPAAHFQFDDGGGIAALQGDAKAEATVRDMDLSREGLTRAREAAIAATTARVKALLEALEGADPALRAAVRAVVATAFRATEAEPYSAAVNAAIDRVLQA